MSDVLPDYSMVFCDCAFSQPGGHSKTNGVMAQEGFSANQLRRMCASLNAIGVCARIVDLRADAESKGASASTLARMDEAVVLVIHDGANALTNDPQMANKMLREHQGLAYDTKTLMYNKVREARSRRNLYFADEARPSDMANGQNTVVAWSSVPANVQCLRALTERLGTTEVNTAVANYYPDPRKCGIGWHGDAERRQTIMVRLGAGSNTRPIHFMWCEDAKRIVSPVTIDLQHGDVLVPCAKAVGTDYKRKSVPTVRHATGFPSGKSVLLQPPAIARPPKRQRESA